MLSFFSFKSCPGCCDLLRKTDRLREFCSDTEIITVKFLKDKRNWNKIIGEQTNELQLNPSNPSQCRDESTSGKKEGQFC